MTADRMDTEWALFADWCTATGRQALPATRATVEAFFEQIPAAPATLVKRARAIRRRHEAIPAAPPIAVSRPGPETIGPDHPQWPVVRAALGRCPGHGPYAIAGRRDAWILVLRKIVGLTRREIRHLSAADVDTDHWHIGDRPVPRDDDTRACPRCAIARWLALLAVVTARFRDDGRTLVRSPRLEGHACTHPIPSGWHEAHTLTPAIDPHLWFSDIALSPRTLAAITTARMASRGPWDDLDVPTSRNKPVDAAGARRDLDNLLNDLDEANALADQAIARMQAALSADPETIRQWNADRAATPPNTQS